MKAGHNGQLEYAKGALFYYYQMIKQSKINSFLDLISKAHSQQKKHTKMSPFRKSKILTEQSPSRTIFDGQVSFIYHNHYELEGMGLEYTQSNFKDTFRERLKGILGKMKQEKDGDKSNLYEAYRRSMDKKLSHYTKTRNSYNIGNEKERLSEKQRTYIKNAHQISFPSTKANKNIVSQQNKTKNHKRRQLTAQSPINSSKNVSPKRIKTEGVLQAEPHKTNLKKVLERQEFQEFRPQPPSIEPMFRIQKCPAHNYQDQLNKKLSHKREEQKHRIRKCSIPPRQSWNSIDHDIKTEDKHLLGPFSALKKSMRYLKKMERFSNLEKVAPWESAEIDSPLYEES